MARLSIEELLEMSELPPSLLAKRQASSGKKSSVQRVPLPAPVGLPKACGPTAPRQATAGSQAASSQPARATPGPARSATTPASTARQPILTERPSSPRVPFSCQPAPVAPVEPARSLPSGCGKDVDSQSSGSSRPALTTPRREKVAPDESLVTPPPGPMMAHGVGATPTKVQLQSGGQKPTKTQHLDTSKSHASAPEAQKASKARPAALESERQAARELQERIADLEEQKQAAVEEEDFDEAKRCKEEIERLGAVSRAPSVKHIGTSRHPISGEPIVEGIQPPAHCQQQQTKCATDPSTPEADSWELVPFQSPETDELAVMSTEKPAKRPSAKIRWDVQAIRGLELEKVPLAKIAKVSETSANGRPKRLRIPPIEFWRNERLEYERLPGSICPSVKAVVRNVATYGKPLLALEDRPEQLAIEDRQLALGDREAEASSSPEPKRRRRNSSNSEEFNITGNWVMTDSKSGQKFEYHWTQTAHDSFIGEQLNEGKISRGKIDGDSVSWLVSGVGCTGYLASASKLVDGNYFNATTAKKLGSFTGERQDETASSRKTMRGLAEQESPSLAIEDQPRSSSPPLTKRRRYSSKRAARSPSPPPVAKKRERRRVARSPSPPLAAKRGRRRSSGAHVEDRRASSQANVKRGKPARK
mmetsp:Transcript_118694/g.221864  ORF Transcript_118694/g.221864 Transcript_118694/m.221864 type:complete len:649 (-) Transcript_118694:71-2017(-)